MLQVKKQKISKVVNKVKKQFLRKKLANSIIMTSIFSIQLHIAYKFRWLSIYFKSIMIRFKYEQSRNVCLFIIDVRIWSSSCIDYKISSLIICNTTDKSLIEQVVIEVVVSSQNHFEPFYTLAYVSCQFIFCKISTQYKNSLFTGKHCLQKYSFVFK